MIQSTSQCQRSGGTRCASRLFLIYLQQESYSFLTKTAAGHHWGQGPGLDGPQMIPCGISSVQRGSIHTASLETYSNPRPLKSQTALIISPLEAQCPVQNVFPCEYRRKSRSALIPQDFCLTGASLTGSRLFCRYRQLR